MIAEPLPSYHPAPSRPRLRLPALACDSHAHVLGPRTRFPFAKGRSATPADAPKERLFALHDRLGIERGIVVQPACHGYDNFVTTEAIAAKGGAYRGVALVPADVPRNELRRLDALGFCGARIDFSLQKTSMEKAAALTARLAEVGWHLRVHLESGLIEELGARLRHSPVPVLIEHMGRIDASLGAEQPAFRALLQLMENERFWVEVSGAVPLARVLVARFGNRVLWGTRWPHQDVETPPDDGRLVDLLSEIAPGEAQLQALLVRNPQRLFRFVDERRFLSHKSSALIGPSPRPSMR
jgi:2-pyrone-4,6-dicarboxylate lactonase